MISSHVGSLDSFLILGLNDLQFLVLGLIHFVFQFFYGELIKPSSLNQISPTPLNKPPALLSSPSNVFEIDNHPQGGGGRVKRGFTVYEGNYATGMFARNKKVHSARFITKSTNYYFSIEPMTGWLLRPIIRLVIFILDTCTIEQNTFTMLRVMRAYTSYVPHIGSRISKH